MFYVCKFESPLYHIINSSWSPCCLPQVVTPQLPVLSPPSYQCYQPPVTIVITPQLPVMAVSGCTILWYDSNRHSMVKIRNRDYSLSIMSSCHSHGHGPMDDFKSYSIKYQIVISSIQTVKSTCSELQLHAVWASPGWKGPGPTVVGIATDRPATPYGDTCQAIRGKCP